LEKDTTIRIIGLEPYTSCFIELDPNSFESIAWQLTFRTMNVTVDPDMLKTIEVPVIVAGEANGTVTIEENGLKRGQDRVIVNFFNEKMKPAGRTLTEQDGYFSLFGLYPGKYIVMIDTVQLRKLEMTSEPDSIPFSIKTGLEGEIIDNLNFNLTRIGKISEEVIQPKPPVRKDTVYMVVHEVVEELVTIAEDSYAIQLGAFKRKSNAEALKKKLEQIFGKKVDIVVADDFYKVRINNIKTRAEVDEKIEVLRRHGITELWVILLKAKQQQWILREKKDSIATIRDRIDTSLAQPELPPMMSIQVGAFRSNAYAIALKNKVVSLVSNPVEIIFEDGYYKVRITGFTNKIDIERILPSLGLMGLRDVWVPPVKAPAKVTKPAAVPVETAKPKIEVPAPEIKKEPEIKPEEKPKEKVAEVPPVSMWVGEFIKKSQALRAQRRIKSKLDLDSEIAERWGYYYIVIGGFYTREETYRYYPELAGIGYTKISVIEKQ
jgi:cell division protein FtsN